MVNKLSCKLVAQQRERKPFRTLRSLPNTVKQVLIARLGQRRKYGEKRDNCNKRRGGGEYRERLGRALQRRDLIRYVVQSQFRGLSEARVSDKKTSALQAKRSSRGSQFFHAGSAASRGILSARALGRTPRFRFHAPSCCTGFENPYFETFLLLLCMGS